MEWTFIVLGAIFIGIGFFIKAFPYFGSYTADELLQMDIEKYAAAVGYLLIVLGGIIAVAGSAFSYFRWYEALGYTMNGSIIVLLVGLVVFRVIYVRKGNGKT